jgi:hypothetical protein
MDCFRSGLEGPVEVGGFDAALDGRFVAPGWGSPKKSRPSNESAGFVCLGGG